MTPNDSQIEVLIRREAARPRRTSTAGGHLDADALNAFAESALPAATRSLFISHLADCDECRKLVSELSIHAGPDAAAQTSEAKSVPTSWWKSLAGFIALPAFRYAAVAVALIAVVGITFLVWRRSNPSSSEFVAQNQPAASPVSAATNGAGSQNAGTAPSAEAEQPSIAKAVPQPTAMPNTQEKTGESAAPAPPPKAQTGNTITESAPVVADNKPAAPARAEATPSFARQPAETTESRMREQQNVGGITHGGPRRSESEKYKVLEQSRPADVAKEEDRVRGRADVDDNKKEKNLPKQSSQSGTLSMSAGAARDERAETRKSENTLIVSSTTTASTRSVGGRKFQRNGNAWVDAKFKSSMSVRNIARGSEEFDALDSKLKSIAQQLSGEIIVVWKGKAYRIR